MTELLDCPFCGTEIDGTIQGRVGSAWIECPNCHAQTAKFEGIQVAGLTSDHKAIAAWNTRPTPPSSALGEEIRKLAILRAWCQGRADDCMKGKRPTIARRHYAQAFLTVVEKIDLIGNAVLGEGK